LAAGLAGLALLVLALGAGLLALLRPAPDEWSMPLRLGPWQQPLSVPALLRIGTHPLVLRALDGRTLATRFGAIEWHAGDRSAGADHWRAVCAPCRLQWRELGDEPLVLARVELLAHRPTPDQWTGEFVLGDAPHAVRGRFRAGFGRQGATIDLDLPDTPIADAYGLFAGLMPEVRQARIEGRLRLQARWRWPQRELVLRPQIDGFVVQGLHTEALLGAKPACAAPPARGFGTWLPRAVVAAEDQRFYEHSGYDLREMSAAWSDGRSDARGASTLSQQLARLLYAGHEHNQLRKLRELLYAVELDRTLGKARVLDLYLSIAPWGEGRCGATEAARHYLHKRVDRLTPTEAAWLASLLHSPQRDWNEFTRSGEVNVRRVGWVIEHLRPMPPRQRAALVDALPGWSPPRP
ncbi:MAG TPA: biosynthetic peptidoglycan transglycosylase, partial [Albitalea sp.]|nr:biosynthetic peptidoglycan transglycosylase [Albitalea sp.]